MKRREVLRGIVTVPAAGIGARAMGRPAPVAEERERTAPPPWPEWREVELNEWGWFKPQGWASEAVAICRSGMVIDWDQALIAFAQRLCPIPVLIAHRAIIEDYDDGFLSDGVGPAYYAPQPTFRETNEIMHVNPPWRIIPPIRGLYVDPSPEVYGQRWGEPYAGDRTPTGWIGDFVGGGLRERNHRP